MYVYVLWYSSPNLLSRLIRRVTKSPYSHVAIEIDGVLYEALARGIVRREGEEAHTRSLEALTSIQLPVHKTDKDQMQFWLEGQVGNSYSVLGLLVAGLSSLGLPAPVLALNGEFVCSGAVATALQIGGYFNPKTDPRLETPASLADRLLPEGAIE